ncbi:VOC family protein [Candidatus Micrarchaeota archaeon]|nr:VOC family protein [Candidatus Micrarchaeota archaeon]MBU1681308.1 VOC family protein [Candidatus Micrarchaeota archaeon]
MPTIVHFEIPADDLGRARKFYGELFGWKIENVGNPSGKADGDYLMVSTTNDDGDPGVGGGLMKRKGAFHMPTNYIGVPNVEEAAKKVEELGGKIVMGKTAVPGMGYFVCCLDTENNPISLWEDAKEAKSD